MAGLVHGSIDMDAMERKFLTTNLTKEDIDDTRANDSGDDADDGDPDHGYDYNPEVEAIAAAKPLTDKSMLTMNRTQGNNTGPKGVQADYQEWLQHNNQETKQAAQDREQLLERLAKGATTTTASVSYSALEAQRALEKKVNGRQGSDDDEEALLDTLEDDEDTFMEAYRQKRKEEYQKKMQLPKYGKVTNVDAYQFVDRMEATHKEVYIVVHLYETGIKACNALDIALESLAREHPHTDFLRLRKSDTPTRLPVQSLPSLLIYKGGEQVDTVMAVVDQIGDKCGKNEVEELLVEKGCIGR